MANNFEGYSLIDLYSKYRENILQAFTKTVVTYQWIKVQGVWSYNFHHRTCHGQGNRQVEGKIRNFRNQRMKKAGKQGNN